MAFLKDDDKQLLLDRYLDFEWPDDINDLRCVRCDRVVINHHVSNCQHLYCNNCRRVFSDGGQWKCPRCHEYVTQLDDQDFDVEVKIHQMKIFCPNKKYGCKYKHQLRNIPKHLMTCVDTREAALPVLYTGTNRNDAVDVQLSDVYAAIRELKDGMSSTFSEQVKKIDDGNSKLNALTEGINSLEQKSERSELASVKYAEEFRSMKLLLESVNRRVQQNELLIQMMMEQIEQIHLKISEVENVQETETYEWTIKDVAKTIIQVQDKWIFESEAFEVPGCRYEIRAIITKIDGYPVIALQFKEGERINNFLKKKVFTTVKYIVKDKSDNLKKHDIICGTVFQFYQCYRLYDWIFVCTLPDEMLFSPYVKNDCINVTIVFEPPSIDHNFVSNNGVLKWRVDNYEARKEAGLGRDIWSPSFYTSPQGYRVKTELVINIKGSMLVIVVFLTGEHDNSLSINWPHKTTITLYNQTDPSKNLVKSEQREDVQLYRIPLEISTFIDENGFVKDDSLLLSVVIEPVISEMFIK